MVVIAVAFFAAVAVAAVATVEVAVVVHVVAVGMRLLAASIAVSDA